MENESSVVNTLPDDSIDSSDEKTLTINNDNTELVDKKVRDSLNYNIAKTSIIENETVKLEDEEELSEITFKRLCLFDVTKNGLFKCKLRHREDGIKSEKYCYNLKTSFQSIEDHLRKFHNTSGSKIRNLSEYVDGPLKIPLTVLVILFIFFIFSVFILLLYCFFLATKGQDAILCSQIRPSGFYTHRNLLKNIVFF